MTNLRRWVAGQGVACILSCMFLSNAGAEPLLLEGALQSYQVTTPDGMDAVPTVSTTSMGSDLVDLSVSAQYPTPTNYSGSFIFESLGDGPLVEAHFGWVVIDDRVNRYYKTLPNAVLTVDHRFAVYDDITNTLVKAFLYTGVTDFLPNTEIEFQVEDFATKRLRIEFSYDYTGAKAISDGKLIEVPIWIGFGYFGVTAVPEPQTGALLLGGLALVAMAARTMRRRDTGH